MSAAGETDRDPAERCVSSDVEKKGRTHLCRLHKTHAGDHICVCSRHWKGGAHA